MYAPFDNFKGAKKRISLNCTKGTFWVGSGSNPFGARSRLKINLIDGAFRKILGQSA